MSLSPPMSPVYNTSACRGTPPISPGSEPVEVLPRNTSACRTKGWHAAEVHGEQIAVLHSPFFGSGKLEYYLATRRPALKVRGVDAFEPVANLHRCYLRQDPVFLRSLAPGGAQSRQALILQSPSAGHSERPRRAPGRLLIRPALHLPRPQHELLWHEEAGA